jgi:hypothetical protein
LIEAALAGFCIDAIDKPTGFPDPVFQALASSKARGSGPVRSFPGTMLKKAIPAIFGRAPSMACALRAAKLPRFVPDESVNVACEKRDFAALPQI